MLTEEIPVKKSQLSDSQIIGLLIEAEAGAPVPGLCRTHGMSNATFYKWRAKFGGMDASLMSRRNELKDENRRRKKMYAEGQMLWWGRRQFRCRRAPYSMTSTSTSTTSITRRASSTI
jgi:putative transposase